MTSMGFWHVHVSCAHFQWLHSQGGERFRVGLAQNQVNKGKGVRSSTHITPTRTGEGCPPKQKINQRPDRRSLRTSSAPLSSPSRPCPNTPGSPPGPARQPVPQRPATDLSGPSGTRHEASETVCFQQRTFYREIAKPVKREVSTPFSWSITCM